MTGCRLSKEQNALRRSGSLPLWSMAKLIKQSGSSVKDGAKAYLILDLQPFFAECIEKPLGFIKVYPVIDVIDPDLIRLR